MIALDTLDVSHNKIKRLPEEPGELVHLRVRRAVHGCLFHTDCQAGVLPVEEQVDEATTLYDADEQARGAQG